MLFGSKEISIFSFAEGNVNSALKIKDEVQIQKPKEHRKISGYEKNLIELKEHFQYLTSQLFNYK